MAASAPSGNDTVVASAARTAGSSTTSSLDRWCGCQDIAAKLVVTNITGALDVTIEHCDTVDGEYVALDTFDQVTATTTGVTRVVWGILKRYVRVGWTVTTGPCTFSVTFASSAGRMIIG